MRNNGKPKTKFTALYEDQTQDQLDQLHRYHAEEQLNQSVLVDARKECVDCHAIIKIYEVPERIGPTGIKHKAETRERIDGYYYCPEHEPQESLYS
jgi:hypothetical protein